MPASENVIPSSCSRRRGVEKFPRRQTAIVSRGVVSMMKKVPGLPWRNARDAPLVAPFFDRRWLVEGWEYFRYWHHWNPDWEAPQDFFFTFLGRIFMPQWPCVHVRNAFSRT
jgi:hypothetical protein